jgi:hypothetical protein
MIKLLLSSITFALSIYSVAQTANRFDVVITEIMADPTPQVGLPNAEYIELKNVSSNAFNLNGWRISDASGTATISASFVLQPDSFVILCANSNVATFSSFGRTIGVTSFPSLDNDGDQLTLRSPQNRIIHALAYTTEWYANEAKKDGGWSLEMIDPKNPCSGKSNWKASTNNLGGTPGKVNSVNGVNVDQTPPQLKRAYALDSVTVVLVFDEPLDSSSASVTANYSASVLTIISANAIAPLFNSVQLKFSSPLQRATVYNLTTTNVTDCKGNAIGVFNKTKISLAEEATANDVVINEMLFDPRSGAYDYVELFNRSNKIVDAGKLYIANRSSAGAVASLNKLSEQPFYVFPSDYIVVTEDAVNLSMQYLVKNSDAVLTLSSLPSYPDDKGAIVLLNLNGDVVDEVAYNKDWHFGLIADAEGVALERIDPDGLSQNKANWHSAASTAGYGTPTYQNSQYKQTNSSNAKIELSSKTFSPDGDGIDDVLLIQYSIEERGYVANIIIFDASGRQVRQLVKNDLLALKGVWKWDGLNEKGLKLPIGTYIIYTEMFNLQGKKESFKNTVVLARKLN